MGRQRGLSPGTGRHLREDPCDTGSQNHFYKYVIDAGMQPYIVEKTDDSVTIAFKDANLTLITPLMDALYKDDNVELVRYIDKHPELENRRLYVKVKSGSPIEAIEKASDAVSEYYSVKE